MCCLVWNLESSVQDASAEGVFLLQLLSSWFYIVTCVYFFWMMFFVGPDGCLREISFASMQSLSSHFIVQHL